jgi:hypothetical protein
MAFRGNFSNEDIVVKQSKVRQLVDIIQADIASTSSRKTYDVFTKSGTPDITSSLFHTVFDQNFSLQTSNEMLDITIGAYAKANANGSFEVCDETIQVDNNGKLNFADTFLMGREKVNIYKQYAQVLLGDSSASFHSPYSSSDDASRIDYPIFINIKRLFTRDGLDKDQFSIKLYNDTSAANNNDVVDLDVVGSDTNEFNLYTDSDASSNLSITSIGGAIGNIKSPDSSSNVGLIFYDKGIVILDAEKVFNVDQVLTGDVATLSGTETWVEGGGNKILDLWKVASIDQILNHICGTRFGTAVQSAMGFINTTSINSSIYIARVGPNDCNYSSNPTYTDDDGTIRCIQDKGDDPFSYVTTIGLYSGNDLVAVAKTSRPIEKNPEVDLSISVRLDF